MAGALQGKKSEIEVKIRAREFVFGIQDGLISTVGLLTGVSAATGNRTAVVVTGIAAALTGGLSMATGSYLSAKTEQEIFDKEYRDQENIAASEPYLAQEALMESLCSEGLDRASAYRVVQLLGRRRDLLITTVQEKVLGLGTADLSQPVKAAAVMFVSFMIGAVIPILPYLLTAGRMAMPVSWALSVLTLLSVGVAKGRMTGRPLFLSGLEFAGVALFSSAAGWLIGQAIQAGAAALGVAIRL
jgi:vacuolar iron transporter family protein